MIKTKGDNCEIRYFDNMIVLDGEQAAIHAEATSILRRFASSSKQYMVYEDSDEHIVLLAHN